MSDQSGHGFYDPTRAPDRTDRVQRPAPAPVSEDAEQQAVEEYLRQHFPGQLSDEGTFVIDRS